MTHKPNPCKHKMSSHIRGRKRIDSHKWINRNRSPCDNLEHPRICDRPRRK